MKSQFKSLKHLLKSHSKVVFWVDLENFGHFCVSNCDLSTIKVFEENLDHFIEFSMLELPLGQSLVVIKPLLTDVLTETFVTTSCCCNLGGSVLNERLICAVTLCSLRTNLTSAETQERYPKRAFSSRSKIDEFYFIFSCYLFTPTHESDPMKWAKSH